jgi:hypothetical protein
MGLCLPSLSSWLALWLIFVAPTLTVPETRANRTSDNLQELLDFSDLTSDSDTLAIRMPPSTDDKRAEKSQKASQVTTSQVPSTSMKRRTTEMQLAVARLSAAATNRKQIPIDEACSIRILQNLNFRDRVPLFQPQGFWVPVTWNGTVSDDGILLPGSPNGGFLNSQRFTHSVPQADIPLADSFKYLALYLDPLLIPPSGMAEYKVCASAHVYGIHKTPFPPQMIQAQDVRLASAIVTTLDLQSGIAIGFLLTNDRLYGLYERWPVGPWAAFTYIIPLATRRPTQQHALSIRFDASTKKAYYLIQNEPHFELSNIGNYMATADYLVLDYGGVPTSSFPTALHIAFGTRTLLDAYPACKLPLASLRATKRCAAVDWLSCAYPQLANGLVKAAARPYVNPVCGPAADAFFFDSFALPRNTLFGQGVTLDLQRLVAFSKKCIQD